MGTVRIFEDLFIQNVLFVPNFSYNLISISKLISRSNCTIIFSTNECLIQDKISTKKIGTTSLQLELYVIKNGARAKGDSSTQICNNIVKDNVWHMCLGHPSQKRMEVFNKKFPYVTLPTNSNCDVFHLAKQRKLPFPSSTSYANSVFDLIHVDIWGPCTVTSMNGDKYFLTIVDNHSRFTWLYIMKKKAEAPVHLVNFVVMIKTQFRKGLR